MKLNPRTSRHSKGFTLMELLVVIAIILVLAAIAFPVWRTVQIRANRDVALNNMRQLGAAAGSYASQNDGQLPMEDSIGAEGWATAAKPENVHAWYNALPVLLGMKSVAQYGADPKTFYSKENLVWLPGAQYPESDERLQKPIYAIAFNTKLQRKDPANPNSEKPRVRLSQIVEPSRTVLFLEQGIKGESSAHDLQSKNDYDGSPKGSAKSFVARYNGSGIITFVDGHAEAIEGKDILAEDGGFPWPLDPGDLIWGRSREDLDNPNK